MPSTLIKEPDRSTIIELIRDILEASNSIKKRGSDSYGLAATIYDLTRREFAEMFLAEFRKAFLGHFAEKYHDHDC